MRELVLQEIGKMIAKSKDYDLVMSTVIEMPDEMLLEYFMTLIRYQR